MMVGVNTFSAILCLVSLLEQGTFFSSFSFMLSHEGFSRDSFLLSISGAVGQVRRTSQYSTQDRLDSTSIGN